MVKIVARVHRTKCETLNRVDVMRDIGEGDVNNHPRTSLWKGFEGNVGNNYSYAIERAREYAEAMKLPFEIEREAPRNCGEPECPHCDWNGRPHTWI